MSGPAVTSARPLRSDAAKNLRRIHDAALVAFSTQGTDVTMEHIAQAAGVGVGTLYRRYPNKDALVDDLLRSILQELIDAKLEHREPEFEEEAPNPKVVNLMDALKNSLGGKKGGPAAKPAAKSSAKKAKPAPKKSGRAAAIPKPKAAKPKRRAG